MSKEKSKQYQEQDYTDSVYIIEEILGSRRAGKGKEYHIKWESYQETTWEPEKNIPSSIRNYYDRTGNSRIPVPKVKEARRAGTTVQYELVWTEDSSLPDWDPEKHVLLEPESVPATQERVSAIPGRTGIVGKIGILVASSLAVGLVGYVFCLMSCLDPRTLPRCTPSSWSS